MKNKINAAGLPKIAPSNMAFCRPIIPLAFDNSLSYYEFIAKINGKLNETICVVNRQNGFLFDFQKAVDVKLNAFNTELVNFKSEWEYYQTEINGIVSTINYRATEALDTANAAAATAQEAATTAATYGGRIAALENQHVGRISPTGETVTIDGVTYTYGTGAEYFNEYEGATKNNAVGNNSHASGGSSNAIGAYSFAHGGAVNVGGDYSAAFGRENYADGDNSFAAGKMNFANGDNSSVFGIGNTASAAGALVCGEYADTDINTAFAVGNGTSNAPGNAFKVDKSGNLYVGGNAKALNESIDENRAALIEIVDGGAKNALPFPSISDLSGTLTQYATINNGIITISIPSGLTSDGGVNYTVNVKGNTYIFSSIENSSTSGLFDSYIQKQESGAWVTVIRDNETAPGNIVAITEGEYRVTLRLRNGAPAGDYIFKPMLCTLPAWDISHAFQPYRLPYDEICRRLEYFVTAITESEYAALSTKNNNTLYAVLPNNAQRNLNLAPAENDEETEETEEAERR